ncbi:HAD family hydrolase [Desulfonema magnum]|uniref:HAD domain-containing protein n=1 Tax=Desulfonema magnum TaxID=45655 RepID=A0A975GT77_9BACT|nr:ATPase P [Desulfonema magnum]QTA92801.1 HAD domain-containing protein [Desulfonema magnum]
MIEIKIPGYKENKPIQLRHLVLDYNGTLAYDGQLLTGVRECLKSLADTIQIHVLTADTFGSVRSQLEDIPCELYVLPSGNQEIGKLEYVKHLGCEHTISVGNGRNDRLMLKESALGIAVILEEGVAVETLSAADIVFTNIVSALEILINPLRLTATLRS